MKKVVVIFMILASQNLYSQIKLDFQSTQYLYHFKLTYSETKYYINDPALFESSNKLVLYNIDGSTYKTIQLPVFSNENIYYLELISRSLFDTDSTNIEYLACYQRDSLSKKIYHTRVIREDGTILLDENYGMGYFFGNGGMGWTNSAFATESGMKLILSYFNGVDYYKTKVFSLPGKLPNNSIENDFCINNNLILYPNPNNGSFFLKFQTDKEKNQTIDLYSIDGKLLQTFKSFENPTFIISNPLSDGIYFLNTRSNVSKSYVKMIIKN